MSEFRVQYHVVWKKTEQRWRIGKRYSDGYEYVIDPDSGADGWYDKDSAVIAARRICRQEQNAGNLCELQVHNENGQFGSIKETYGKDPERSPG